MDKINNYKIPTEKASFSLSLMPFCGNNFEAELSAKDKLLFIYGFNGITFRNPLVINSENYKGEYVLSFERNVNSIGVKLLTKEDLFSLKQETAILDIPENCFDDKGDKMNLISFFNHYGKTSKILIEYVEKDIAIELNFEYRFGNPSKITGVYAEGDKEEFFFSENQEEIFLLCHSFLQEEPRRIDLVRSWVQKLS